MSQVTSSRTIPGEEQLLTAPPTPIRELPSVDLLPSPIRQRFAIRRIVRRGIFGAVVILAIAIALWWSQNAAITDAQQDLTVAQDVNTELQARASALAPLGALSSALTTTQEFVELELQDQPQGSVPISRLVEIAETLPGPAVPISSASITYHGLPSPGDELNPCPSPNPFDTEITAGCMTFSAVAKSREQVSALLRALESDTLFVGPYVTGTSIATDVDGSTNVAISGTVGLSPEVLTNPPTDEELAQLAEAVTTENPDPDAAQQGGSS